MGGRFLLHVIDYDKLRCDKIRHACKRGMISGLDTVVTKIMVPTDSGMRVTIFVQQNKNGVWVSDYETEELFDIPDSEIISFAEESGLELNAVYSDLAKSVYEPGKGSDRVFEFIKA